MQNQQPCQGCGKRAYQIGETASGPRSVCSTKCLVNLFQDAKIASDAGDDLARRVAEPKFTIAFDFDLTLTKKHSCTGRESVLFAKDMSEHVDAKVLKEFFAWLRNSGRLNWIISFGNVDTIRQTMTGAGLDEFFRVPIDEVPPSVQAHRLFSRMVKGEYFWRILTPSVLLGMNDCTKPANPDDMYKISFMSTALTITNLFLSEKSDDLVAPREFMLIDDTEENVSRCARKGFAGLAINPQYQLANSLDFAKAKDAKDLNWLQILFDRVELVEKEASLWATEASEKWTYYKIA